MVVCMPSVVLPAICSSKSRDTDFAAHANDKITSDAYSEHFEINLFTSTKFLLNQRRVLDVVAARAS